MAGLLLDLSYSYLHQNCTKQDSKANQFIILILNNGMFLKLQLHQIVELFYCLTRAEFGYLRTKVIFLVLTCGPR